MTYDHWKTTDPRDAEYEPERIVNCPDCGGEGVIYKAIWVYERGCGFPHEDVSADACSTCNGVGFEIGPAA
jgi:hypothetical protein